MSENEEKPFFEKKKELKRESKKVANLKKEALEGELVIIARSLGTSLQNHLKNLEGWYTSIVDNKDEKIRTKKKNEASEYEEEVIKELEGMWEEKKKEALDSFKKYFKKLI